MSSAYVITSPKARFSEDKLYSFMKTIYFKEPHDAEICITADARYKLWINEKLVSFGPYKGCDAEKYYDCVSIADFLVPGENSFFAEVLQLSNPSDIAKHHFLQSVHRTGNMAFALWGYVYDGEEKKELFTDESWLCAEEKGIQFIVPTYAYYAGLNENVKAVKQKKWQNVVNLCKMQADNILNNFQHGETKLWFAKGHDLPQQIYVPTKLSRQDANGVYDAQRIVTGFIKVKAHGSGKIKLIYAESYAFQENGAAVKQNRTDINGTIVGDYDTLELEGSTCYETFWFRTFRFIKIEKDESVLIDDIEYAATGYPLEILQEYDFGSESDNKLWNISINTLQCCMHETYEDCPYYEQLQYAMDTYLQIVYSLQIAEDDRLAKRAIHHFALSVHSGSICQSRYPSVVTQYIPGFSLFLVWMLDILEKKRGEHEFIKNYLGVIDMIFQSIKNDIRPDGLLRKNLHWNFIDWAEPWRKNRGVPDSDDHDALTVYNMMVVSALKCAARLNMIFGRSCVANEYLAYAKQLGEKIKEKCLNKELGLYADTDQQKTYSQHAQVWAVLSGIADQAEAAALMKKSQNLYALGSLAYSYFVMRALECAEIYECSESIMDQYRNLLPLNCTTIPETANNPRSECHAWGAVAIYEFTAVVLGVKDAVQDCIEIKPYIHNRKHAKGTVFTRLGEINVEWSVCEGMFRIHAETQNDIGIKILMPDQTWIEGRKSINAECEITH